MKSGFTVLYNVQPLIILEARMLSMYPQTDVYFLKRVCMFACKGKEVRMR